MSAEFTAFALAQGVIIDRPNPDNRRHRAATTQKPKKKNAWYRFDGEFGWVLTFDGSGSGEQEFFRPDKPMDPARAAEFRRKAQEASDERERDYKLAAREAQEVAARSRYDAHPYFTKKGLYQCKGLVDPVGVKWRRDEAPRPNCLIVPMRNAQTGDLQSIQWIDSDGAKHFLEGGRAGGAAFTIGPRFGPTWFCEGFATGLSIVEALKSLYRTHDRVVVCFSAWNMKQIAMASSGPRYVMADNDAPDKLGRQAGQEAARATQLPWTMPEVEDEDWNDVYQSEGVHAVAKAMRGLLLM